MIRAADDYDFIRARLQQLQGSATQEEVIDLLSWVNPTTKHRWYKPISGLGFEVCRRYNDTPKGSFKYEAFDDKIGDYWRNDKGERVNPVISLLESEPEN